MKAEKIDIMTLKSIGINVQSNKYGAKKAMRIIAGEPVQFDSIREADRWDELRLMERAGRIKNLRRQVKYELIPAGKRADGKLERACHYVADFVYVDPTGTIVEDVKGHRTPDYIIKRKLMLWRYGITIKEV